MTYSNKKNLSCLVLGISCVFMIACTSVQEKFESAAKSGRIDSLKIFLEQNPDSLYTEQTRTIITNIALKKARAENTEAAYQKIINENPGNTALYRLASGKIESINYSIARSINTIAAYKAFLSRFPFGKSRTAAQSHIESIQYRSIKENASLASIKEYLKTAKLNKEDIKQAKIIQEKLSFEQAVATNTIDAYQAFVTKYENSIYAIKATERLLNLRLPSTVYLSDKGHVSIQLGKITSISDDKLVATYGKNAKQAFILSKNTLVCSKNGKSIAPTNLHSNQNISIATIPATNQNTAIAIYVGDTKIKYNRKRNSKKNKPDFNYFPNCFPPLSNR